jgi:hypothetical protein
MVDQNAPGVCGLFVQLNLKRVGVPFDETAEGTQVLRAALTCTRPATAHVPYRQRWLSASLRLTGFLRAYIRMRITVKNRIIAAGMIRISDGL